MSISLRNSIKLVKTLLNTKRRISLRGSFVQVKGKAYETVGDLFSNAMNQEQGNIKC
jgi:hypothetical protein